MQRNTFQYSANNRGYCQHFSLQKMRSCLPPFEHSRSTYNPRKETKEKTHVSPYLIPWFPILYMVTNIMMTEACENPCTPRPRVAELDPNRHPAPGPGFLNRLRAVLTSSALSVLCSRNSTINRCFHPRLREIDSSNPERPDRSSR